MFCHSAAAKLAVALIHLPNFKSPKRSNRADRLDSDSGVERSVTSSLLGMLTTSELLDVNLFALLRSKYRCGYSGAVKRWCAQSQPILATDAQDFAQRDAFAGSDFTVIQVKFHAWFNAVLATAVDDDGVHKESASMLTGDE
jgi:hypothetical protein